LEEARDLVGSRAGFEQRGVAAVGAVATGVVSIGRISGERGRGRSAKRSLSLPGSHLPPAALSLFMA
jgi:hypothetical protein